MVSLVEELPYAAAVDNNFLTTTCSSCFATKPENTLRKCIGCKVLSYCNQTCQTNDWPDHKLECKFLKKCSPEIPNITIRMISRVAMKMARGDKSNAFNGRTIEDLMDNNIEMQKVPEAMQQFENVYFLVSQYHGSKFAIDKAQLHSICGKISTNAFGILGEMNKPLGRGLYLGISIHNHSCSPDCFVIFDGAKAIIRSPDIGMKYSSELTVCYVNPMLTKQKRREKLKMAYFFDCCCKLCEDCTHDQLMRSVVCTSCEGGVCLLNPTANQLSCNICKKISPITVAEAVAVNDEVERFLSRNELDELVASSNALSTTDLQGKLKHAIEMHEKFKKILSKFNLSLVAVVRRALYLSMKLRDTEKIHKYALINIPAHKKYLAVGHPDLTDHMTRVALNRGFNADLNVFVVRLYEEAYKMALISHGPEHKFALMIKELMNGGRPWF